MIDRYNLVVGMRKLLFLLGLCIASVGLSQQGGSHSYAFLNLESSARMAASGGSAIAIKDGDANIGFINPSLLDSSMHKSLAINYINYFASVNYGYAGYIHQFGKVTGSANLMYLNYGTFKRTDELGNITGQFVANEMVLSFGAGYQVDTSFSIGSNFKIINSILDSYSSFGLAIDLAGSYHNKAKNFTATVMMRNIGMQLKNYTETSNAPLPFSIDVGISKKAANAPFRILAVMKDLQRWDLTYNDPNAEPELDENGDPIPFQPAGFLEKMMRHFGAGVEFIPSKAFFVDFGFNYRRRQELKLDNRPGMIGFSVGGGIKIKRFMFSYGRASYHRAGASNHITVTTRITK